MPKPKAVSRDFRHRAVEFTEVYEFAKFHLSSSYFDRVILEKRNPVWPY